MTDEVSPVASARERGYEVVERIDAGAYGVVYRARQPSVEREVALKVIKPERASDPEFVAQFETEAQLVARLEHPRIVPLYDFWTDAGGAYLVMRWVAGGSVKDALRRGAFRPEAAQRIVEQLADALDTAHRRGVVHRDLKPGNVLLDRDNNAYLTDFGIARDFDAARPGGPAAAGTPVAMAPEQIRGEETDARTDVYALGLLVWELLAGSHPWDGLGLSDLLDAQLHRAVPSLRERVPALPAGIDEVVATATAKNPDERFDSAGAVADALQVVLAGGEAPRLDDATRVTGTRPAADNPYKGLRAFQEDDALDFFGRQDLIEEVLNELAASPASGRFLAIVGPSGSGKSSLVRAGVVPRLRTNGLAGWGPLRIVDLIPGTHPLEELEAALLREAGTDAPATVMEILAEDKRGLTRVAKRLLPDGHDLLLVIDQFEELFTLVDDAAVRDLVLDSIVAAVKDERSRVRVMVTLRADFFDRPLEYPEFGDLLRRNMVTVVPMSAAGLEAAVRGPAERVGVGLEPSLVTRIVADTADQPGALPLLQYALTELYDRRRGAVLTLREYEEIDGVLGALARRAEQIHSRLDGEGKATSRQLFLRLVTLGEGVEDTRRRVRRSELEGLGDALGPVLEEFGRFRLLSFDRDPVTQEPTVEIAHEALLREWSRLRGWIESSRDDVRAQRRLTQVAGEWIEASNDPSYLLSGHRLAEFDDWELRTNVVLSANEAAFLQASRDAQAEAERIEAERTAREQALETRARNRRRILLVVVTLAAIVSSVLGVFALGESRNAREQARLSRARELASVARDRIDSDPELAVLLAIEAVRARTGAGEDAPPEVADALHRALAAQRIVFRSEGIAAATSGNGDVIAVLTPAGIALLDRNGTETRTVPAPEGTASIAIDATGDRMAIGTESGDVAVLDAATGLTRSGGIDGAHDAAIRHLSFGGEGDRLVVTSSDDGRVRLWDLETGALLLSEAHSGDSVGAAVTRDANRVAYGSGFAGVSVREREGDEYVPLDIEIGSGGSPAAGITADGRWIAAGTGEGSVVVVRSGDDPITFAGHAGPVTAVGFVPESDPVVLVSAGEDGVVFLWDVVAAREITRLGGALGPIDDLAVSIDRAVASGVWGSVGWDISPAGSREGTTFGVGLPTTDVAVSALGDTVITATGDAQLWTIDGALVAELRHERSTIGKVATGGDRFATSGPASLVVWDSAGNRVATLFLSTGISGLETRSGAVAISSDGSLVAGTRGGVTVEVWRASGEALAGLEGHDSFVEAAAFHPDGTLLATGDDDGVIRLWDMTSYTERASIDAHSGGVADLVFDSDGGRLVSAGADDTVKVWDVDAVLAGSAEPRVFAGHQGNVLSVAISADGSTIASGGEDDTVRVWDFATATQLLTLQAQAGDVGGVQFIADGTALLAASADGVTRTYLLDASALVELALERVPRSLTDTECETFLRGPCPD